MSYGLSNGGEVALLTSYFESNTVEMGLYYDATDELSDSDSTSAITTEPNGSLYNRQEVTGSEVDVSLEGGSGVLDVDAQAFNVSDSTQKVDSVFFYNPADGFFLRVMIDTSSYPNDYIPLDQIDNLRISGDALTLE